MAIPWDIISAFGGGIVAVSFGYALNRRRDQKLREEEADSIKGALYWEIRNIQNSTADLGKEVVAWVRGDRISQNQEKQTRLIPREISSTPLLFDHLASGLTLLPSMLVWLISTSYASRRSCLEAFKNYCAALEDSQKEPNPKAVLEPAIKTIETADYILRWIERDLNMERGATPDIRDLRETLDDLSVRRESERG